MKRRILFIGLWLVLALGLGWLLVGLLQGEPVYQGKRLSDWLGGYSPMGGSTNTWEQADAAVGAAGAKAIPTLLRMLGARDSQIKLKLIELAEKQHVIPVRHTPAESLNFQGAMGFRRLGTNAGAAVPALLRIYAHRVSPASRTATLMALDDVAAGGIPLLVKGLDSRDEAVRETIAGVLGRVQGRPEEAVAALVKCLEDPGAGVRATAAAGLARFGTAAAPAAVPALLKARQDPSSQVRDAANYSLERIEPEAAARAGAK